MEVASAQQPSLQLDASNAAPVADTMDASMDIDMDIDLGPLPEAEPIETVSLILANISYILVVHF